MAGPINPITLAMIGAAGGAVLKPNNPLQGALLGATAGYTGGTALGIGAPAAASGGGLTMGAKGVTGLTSGTGATLNAGANTALGGSLGSSAASGATNSLLASQIDAQRALSYAGENIANAENMANIGANSSTGLYGLGGTGTTAGLSAVPATAADTFGNYSLAAVAPANYSLVAPSAVTSVPTPSFMDKVGLSAKSSFENPGQSLAALSATQGLLTPEQQQQIAAAPAMPIQRGPGLKPFDAMAALDPYKQSVIGSPQISLLG
jgi:hypothetical protein